MDINDILFIIPARGGSKGLPRKNILPLAGKPLIYYSIDAARQITKDENICVSTDDDEIISVVEKKGLCVPFKRPAIYSTDEATTNDVLLHAVEYFESKGINYKLLILLQPTSPLRTVNQIQAALNLYTNEVEMVASVRESHAAAVICQENESGYIELTLAGKANRRQDLKNYFEYNGAIYIINIESLKSKRMKDFTKIRKYVMPAENSIDIDTLFDWQLTEFILNKNKA